MTKNEFNEIIDSCFIHLTVMKQITLSREIIH